MGWTALLNVRAWLVIALCAVSTFAVFQHSTIRRLQAESLTAETTLNVAKAANTASTAMVLSLKTERDALLLQRAIETDAAVAAVEQSQAMAKRAIAAYQEARERIRQLSQTTRCMAAMSAPICPQIAQELRAP